jgi:hypothetical protein
MCRPRQQAETDYYVKNWDCTSKQSIHREMCTFWFPHSLTVSRTWRCIPVNQIIQTQIIFQSLSGGSLNKLWRRKSWYNIPQWSLYALQGTGYCFSVTRPDMEKWKDFIQSVTERCGQNSGTSSTYQNKKKHHMNMRPKTFNLWVVAERVLQWTIQLLSTLMLVPARPSRLATSAYRKPLPRFRLTWSAEATGSCTTGSQSGAPRCARCSQ